MSVLQSHERNGCALLPAVWRWPSSQRMRHFLEQVHEFKDGKIQMPNWETALSLTSALTLPNESTFTDIKNAIQTRDALIRKDLIEFIAGQNHRVD